ncbi:hypothetical protein [Ruminococcus sp.]|uniref:DUF6881 domain-containing protein n=1 Tax=Ruminococcus sp. TaxID=41978 RepID=UPI0025EB601B|nr:hypothetical protein [Ruminococcus sp.]MBQ8967476.1 hypothetical protein [Ruminococcus sp.]
MERYEYIKWFWKHEDDRFPILLFYEIDLESGRYAARMLEVYADRRAVPVIEEGFEFITEAPIPPVDEINTEPEFFAQVISKEEFEAAYVCDKYTEEIAFPK